MATDASPVRYASLMAQGRGWAPASGKFRGVMMPTLAVITVHRHLNQVCKAEKSCLLDSAGPVPLRDRRPHWHPQRSGRRQASTLVLL